MRLPLSAAPEPGDRIGVEPFLAGMALGPGSDRSGNPSSLTRIRLGLKAKHQDLATAGLLLAATGPGHVKGVVMPRSCSGDGCRNGGRGDGLHRGSQVRRGGSRSTWSQGIDEHERTQGKASLIL